MPRAFGYCSVTRHGKPSELAPLSCSIVQQHMLQPCCKWTQVQQGVVPVQVVCWYRPQSRSQWSPKQIAPGRRRLILRTWLLTACQSFAWTWHSHALILVTILLAGNEVDGLGFMDILYRVESTAECFVSELLSLSHVSLCR